MERCLESKYLTSALCHGANSAQCPLPWEDFFLMPLLTITVVTPLPKGARGTKHPPTNPQYANILSPVVPTRLHQSECHLAMPQDEPRTQPPQISGVGWLSLTD